MLGRRSRSSVGILARLAAVGAAGLALLLAGPANADTSDDKRRVDRELAQTSANLESVTDRAKAAITQYNQATAALPGAQTALAEARGRVVGAQSAARQAEREAAAAEAAAQDATREYEAAAAEVDQTREEISGFVAAAYRGNNIAMINAIIDSQSPSDLLNSVGYLDTVAERRQAALQEFVAGRMLARQHSDRADAARDKAVRAADAAQQALDAAEAEADAAEQIADSLQAIVVQQRTAAAIADSERGAVLAQYNNLKARSDQLAAELRAVANSGNSGRTVPASSGYLQKPVSGNVSSGFGLRFHPYYHVWRFHTGTDFSAPGGAPIVAAAEGTVVRTGWAGGYGNYTCIHHGMYQKRGLATCYAHQSVILVSTGANVRRGQLIGRVGTTGVSTGNHLHFEVRLDGAPVNPMEWL
ncbi:MAG: M23 family metallopeptidase [Dactylosporangium sp.]|nr:M23 family metallopeptidase [Dactylosporangium sp.]NNJ60631.1 M23 family metallopeptidase [Dactylosporangium sp.]